MEVSFSGPESTPIRIRRRAIDRVLAWDEKTPNGLTSKKDHAAAWKQIRDGLGEMRRYVVENGATIRAQRTANGLENRD